MTLNVTGRLGVKVDVTAALVRMIDTLPERMRDDPDASTVGEAGELIEAVTFLDMPETRAKIASIEGALVLSLMALLRKHETDGLELYRTSAFACERCATTPLTVVVERTKPNVVAFRCGKCSFEQRNQMTDAELAELRTMGVPLDRLGRVLEKQRPKRKRKGVAYG